MQLLKINFGTKIRAGMYVIVGWVMVVGEDAESR